jgi:hypothetical protein
MGGGHIGDTGRYERAHSGSASGEWMGEFTAEMFELGHLACEDGRLRCVHCGKWLESEGIIHLEKHKSEVLGEGETESILARKREKGNINYGKLGMSELKNVFQLKRMTAEGKYNMLETAAVSHWGSWSADMGTDRAYWQEHEDLGGCGDEMWEGVREDKGNHGGGQEENQCSEG